MIQKVEIEPANKKSSPQMERVTIVILICAIIGAGWLVASSNGEKNERITITSVSIESVAEKFHNEDGYYLTVILEDSIVKSYHCITIEFL